MAVVVVVAAAATKIAVVAAVAVAAVAMTANRAGSPAPAVGLPNLVRAQGEDVQKLKGKDEFARGRRIQSLPFCFGVRLLDPAFKHRVSEPPAVARGSNTQF
jgi:hypothetical protein